MSAEVLHLRTLSEEQVRVLLRGHMLGLTTSLHHAIESGDAQKEPVTYALRALAENPCLMRCMVAEGAGLMPAQLDQMCVDLLFNACSEIAMVARRHHGDQRLKAIAWEEMAPFLPTLADGNR